MLITETLDVAIGLVLVYLLASIAMTSLIEAIEGFFKKRATDLEKAIYELLQQDPKKLEDFYKHPLVTALYSGTYTPKPDGDGQPDRSRGHNLPTYIPRDTFSAVLLDLESKNLLDGKLGEAVTALTRAAGFDPAAKRRAIESWYDNAMDRASGWFKRRTQTYLFWIGLFVAVVANLNSVVIADYLIHSPEARKAAVEVATKASQDKPGWFSEGQKAEEDKAAGTTTDGVGNSSADSDGNNSTAAIANETQTDNASAANEAAAMDNGTDAAAAQGGKGTTTPSSKSDQAKAQEYYRDYTAQLEKIGLPIGWGDAARKRTFEGFEGGFWTNFMALILLITGYFLTALAMMLGAPFWFDLLGRLIVMRSTIKPKEKSPDEGSKDGGASHTEDPAATPGAAAPATAINPQIFG